ncbi:MAG: PadR family transcriptional regulator [bacterium]|nr:PadR family transcriptional regulator [bacterium]
MIELVILYELSKSILTMYGISKQIKKDFSVLMLPSYGTISPALKRLNDGEFVQSQKFMSKGGRPSVCYSITNNGKTRLKALLLETMPENPIQFMTNARVRLYCAEILDEKELKRLLTILKIKAEHIGIDTAHQYEQSDNFYSKMIFENLSCEYRNFLSLIEGIEHACTHK